tara:strand:- start:446 stop:1105 length:660 start_codon:yes stop_codon:yes gene_type:complete
MDFLKKKIYRDGSGRILGGVCSGLSFYLSIDKFFLRLAFFCCSFFFGITIPLYAILWAVIPKARTIIERKEMIGEDIDYEAKGVRGTVKQQHSAKDATVLNSTFLDLSMLNKISMLVILFFCSVCLFLIFSFSFSFPFVIDVFRGVHYFDGIKYSLLGVMDEEKVFSIHSFSTLLAYCIPFVTGLIFSLKHLKKIEVPLATFNYLGIAWMISLAINHLF